MDKTLCDQGAHTYACFARSGDRAATGKIRKRRKIVERRMRSDFVVVSDPRIQQSPGGSLHDWTYFQGRNPRSVMKRAISTRYAPRSRWMLWLPGNQ